MASLADFQFQYVEGQGRTTFAALLADYQHLSDLAAAAPGVQTGQAYGPHERQRFDLFAPAGPARGVMLYFHAGYWQSRDKSNFHFLAAGFQARGFFVAMVNYPLCPEVSLPALVDATRASVGAARQHLNGLGVQNLPVVLAGHSAGAHLCAELALSGAGDAPLCAVDGICALSGIYDLQPLVATTLNARLQLTPQTAHAASPLFRVRSDAPPAWWLVGALETPAFLLQNGHMHEAWSAQGNWSKRQVVSQADHFSILRHWSAEKGALDADFDAWWQAVQAHHHQRNAPTAAPSP